MTTKRQQHWEKVYSEKDPLQVSWYQDAPEQSLGLIQHSGITPQDAIIDVGGGASLLVDFLCEYGYQDITILDISASALATSQQRLGNDGNKVKWLITDVTEFEPPQQYALWHDRAVFHFLTTEADQRAYVETASQAIPSGGTLIIAAFATGGPTRCSGLEIVQYDANKLQGVLGEGFDLREQVDETHITPAGKAQHFTYYRLRRC